MENWKLFPLSISLNPQGFVIWNHNFEAMNIDFNFIFILFVLWENKLGEVENLDELAFELRWKVG